MVIIGAMVVGILLMLVVVSGVVMGGALAHKNARRDSERWAREATERRERRDRERGGPGPLGGEPVHA